jgi:hypothetical protein
VLLPFVFQEDTFEKIEAVKHLEGLAASGKVKSIRRGGLVFFTAKGNQR